MKKTVTAAELITICSHYETCEQCLWDEECEEFYQLTNEKCYPSDLQFRILGDEVE